MECPICYTKSVKHSLICGHSFCHECITQWHIECKQSSCPVCRADIEFISQNHIRYVYVQCKPYTSLDMYVKFQELLEKYRGYNINDVKYLRSREWVKWVIEYKAKPSSFTTYTFHGLQGTKEACHKERQEIKETGVLAKAYKD